MKLTRCNIQLGKQGISDNFIESIKTRFKNHENVRVCVLKSAGHEREKMKEYSEEILKKLGEKYTSRIIGFTIFVKKWRKNVKR